MSTDRHLACTRTAVYHIGFHRLHWTLELEDPAKSEVGTSSPLAAQRDSSAARLRTGFHDAALDGDLLCFSGALLHSAKIHQPDQV